jgi:hypothetical protein
MRVPPRNHACGGPQGRNAGGRVGRGRQSPLRAAAIGDAKSEPNYKQPLGGRPVATSEDALSDNAASRYSNSNCAPIAQAL